MKMILFSLLSFNICFAGNLSAILGAGAGKPTLAGTTPTTFNANLGGLKGANQKCHAAFNESHFCSDIEYLKTGDRNASNAWVNGNGYTSATTNTGTVNCSNWTNSQMLNGRYGSTLTGFSPCGTVLPLACCY